MENSEYLLPFSPALALCSIAALITLSLVQVVQADDWLMYGHDAARTGESDEVVEPPLDLLWIYDTGGAVSSPAISDGMIYLQSDNQNMHAIYANGTGKWKYRMESYKVGTHFYHTNPSPAIFNGVVYVGSDDGNLYALDAASGTLKWKYKTKGPIHSSPATFGDIVFVGSDDGNLYALDAASGTLRWNYTTGKKIRSSPAVSSSVVYVASDNGYFYEFIASTGSLNRRPHYVVSSFFVDAEFSSPAISGSMVYISESNILYTFNTRTGSPKWNYEIEGILSSPAISNNVVYVGSNNGFVYALDATNGTLKWKSNNTEGQIRSSPAVSGGVVYVGSGEYLYALDVATGALKPVIYKTEGSVSSIAISGGVVYVGSNDNKLYAFRPPQKLTPTQFPIPITSSQPKSTIYENPAVIAAIIGAMAAIIVAIINFFKKK